MDPRSIILAERMFTVISIFLFSIIAVAYLRNRGFLRESYREYINFIVIYITLPILIFIVIKRSQLDIKLLTLTATAFIVMFFILAIAFLVMRGLKAKKDTYGSFILAATLGNTAYFGYPAVLAVFGEKNLINAVFYDYAIAIFIYTGGIYISQMYGKKMSAIKLSTALVGILKFPAFLALFPALALKGVVFPVMLTSILEFIGTATVPLVLLSIGLSFTIRSLKTNRLLIALIAIFKLLISPLIAYATGILFGLRQDMLSVAVVQAGMPTAMMTVILGSRYGLDVDFLTNTVFITTALSVITLPLIMLILF